MQKLTKKQRHEIYKFAYEIHLADIRYSKRTNNELFGMCQNLKDALIMLEYEGYSVYDLPEFVALKPKNKDLHEFWWSLTNTNITRKKKYKLLMNQTKS